MRMESVDMQVRWYPASSTVQWSVIGDVRITARETARVGCVYTRCAREYMDIAKFAGHLPHRYGNSRAIRDHTVLPATRQR